MYSPRLKNLKSKREKIVSEIVEIIDSSSDLDGEANRNKILEQLRKGQLF